MPVDKQDATSDDHPMSELRALLIERQRSGLPFERMAQIAQKNGHRLSKQYLTQVANGEIKRPSLEKLAAIAAGLPGVSESQVREAAARSQGVHVERNVPYRVTQLLAELDDMSAAGRERWFRLAAAIARELAQEETGAAPRTVIGHEGDRPDAMTERIVGRELDRMEAEEQAKDQRRKRGPH